MSVDGVRSNCDMENRTVTFTSSDTTAARMALDAFAAAGFYGSSDNAQLPVKAVSDIPSGRVNSLKVAGIHNCCRTCCEAIKEAVATVDGVSGNTAEPEVTTFEVTGDFSAVALVKAINAAGFSARVER
jgi:copper chaperone CopZ